MPFGSDLSSKPHALSFVPWRRVTRGQNPTPKSHILLSGPPEVVFPVDPGVPGIHVRCLGRAGPESCAPCPSWVEGAVIPRVRAGGAWPTPRAGCSSKAGFHKAVYEASLHQFLEKMAVVSLL